MADFDWKKVVRTLAPAAATAFGTPVMGLAVTALSNAIFGSPDHSADDVATAISSGSLSGEQIVAIKAADNDFRIKMQQMQIDLARMEVETDTAYLKDVQDARARQVATKDPTPQIILGVAALIYLLQFVIFIFWHLPDDEFTRALIVRGFGTVDGVLLTCVAYFVGSSRGSKQSGDAVRRIAETAPAAPVVTVVKEEK